MARRGLVVTGRRGARAAERALNGSGRLPVPLGRGTVSEATRTLSRSLSWLGVKETFLDASRGQGVGWRPAGGPGAIPDPGPRVTNLMDVYGGTESSVAWVFRCVQAISWELAGYPWQTVERLGREDEKPVDPPDDLETLLREPNPDSTYAVLAFLQQADLELVGNSYWLKDDRNGLGQPSELWRFQPDMVQIVVDRAGKKIGYVVNLPNGVQLPYDRDQIIHFRNPNPRHPHYGMGTVEAIVRTIDAELSESAHVTGFFRNGGNISGVLTVPDTLGEDEFERIKKQYEEELASSVNTFKILIAEGSTDFKPMSGSPQALGVVNLRKLSKDEIFTGMGVPAVIAGGVAEAGTAKMEEAQNIFGRTMKPKGTLYGERVSIDLTSRWDGLGFRVSTEAAEPKSMRIGRAREMLGAGAALNESREEAGLPRLSKPEADEPLVPGGLMPLSQIIARSTMPRPRDLPNVGPDEPHVVGNGNLPTREGGSEGKAPTSGEGEALILAGLRALIEQQNQLRAVQSEAVEVADQLPQLSAGELSPPDLPDGFEDWSGWTVKQADAQVAQRLLDRKARFLNRATPFVITAMVRFFQAQRRRVLKRLEETRAAQPRVKGQPYGSKAPSVDDVWDEGEEEARIENTIDQLLDELGPQTGIDWNPDDAAIAAIRDRIGEDIRGVNETTREQLAEVIAEGVRRAYPVNRIANGYPEESFPGIVGVFDDATEARAGTIARTESATLFNLAHVEEMDRELVGRVEVMDGNYDQACAEADGQVWTLDEARQRVLEHPNCVRTFIPLEE